eukprot:PhF_6_TR10141/c1_g1_i1/m.15753
MSNEQKSQLPRKNPWSGNGRLPSANSQQPITVRPETVTAAPSNIRPGTVAPAAVQNRSAVVEVSLQQPTRHASQKDICHSDRGEQRAGKASGPSDLTQAEKFLLKSCKTEPDLMSEWIDDPAQLKDILKKLPTCTPDNFNLILTTVNLFLESLGAGDMDDIFNAVFSPLCSEEVFSHRNAALCTSIAWHVWQTLPHEKCVHSFKDFIR